MIIPIGTDYRHTLRPWTNYVLIAANVFLFVQGWATGQVDAGPWLLHPEDPQLGQFFSSIFLHGSWGHLAGNMVFLWVFGNAVNDRFGHAGYLAFYLAGGVAAGLGYLLFSGEAPVLGASGAISAVTGAYLLLFPRARVHLLVFLFWIVLPFEVSSLFFLAAQFGFNVLSVMTELEGQSSGVAWFAHIAGYVFGFGVAAAMLAVKALPRDASDLLSLFRAGRRRFEYRRMVSQGFDPFGTERQLEEEAVRRIDARTLQSQTPDTPLADEMRLRREIAEAFVRRDMPAAAAAYLRLLEAFPDAVLSRSNQLDVANQLMSSDRYAEAAHAYERFLQHFANSEYAGDVHLMLGLLYGRYLQDRRRARESLAEALRRLKDPRKIELAEAELAALGPRE